MDRWKSRGGKSQRGDEKKRQDQRRERVRRKKMQVREKVEKLRITVFLQWFVAPEGRKAGSLKRRVRSHLARWEMKSCTPLWREAQFKVKMYEAPHVPSTFGSCDVEKVHAVVARSTFRSQIAQNTPWSEHFWKLTCRKSARRCGVKHIAKSKCAKHFSFGAFLEVEMSKKCTPLWREAHFQVKMYKTHHSRTTFGSWDVEKVHAVVARSTFASEKAKNTSCSDHFWKLRCRKSARRCGAKHVSKSKVQKADMYGALLDRECAPCQKWAKRDGFVAFPKAMAGVGHLKRIRKDAFRVAGAIQETCSSEMLGGQGRDSLRRLHILEHQICRFAKMILRDRCSTSYDLASLFRGKRRTLDRWSGEIAKRIGTRPSALTQLSIFEGSLAELLCFWCCQRRKLRKSRRIVSFLTLSSEKIEEVSQNCYVFWCCQVQKAEGVSQNSFVFKLGDRQIDRRLQSVTTTTTTTALNYDYNDNYTCKYTTLHCTTLITLHYTTLRYTTLH